MFSVPQGAAILGHVSAIMNDLQSKFAFTVVAVGLFFAFALPMMKEAEQDLDAAMSQAGKVYMAPNPNDPNAPSGNVSLDDLQKYADKKAAERKAMGLR
jgi:hypothetical protein